MTNTHGQGHKNRVTEEMPMSRRSRRHSPCSASPSLSEPPSDQERHRKTNLFALPTDAEMLIQEYFATVGLLLPCVHEDSFLALYKQARRTKYKGVRKSWLGLLNMIFALASNTMTATSPMQGVARMSETYYQRALGLATPDLLANTSLEIGNCTFSKAKHRLSVDLRRVVQLLSLMETYLQGTQRSMQAWTFHGLAVKAALQLGLHSAEASKRLPLLEREMRKRTWYWCVINDRYAIPKSFLNSSILMRIVQHSKCQIRSSAYDSQFPNKNGFAAEHKQRVSRRK